MAKSKWKEAFDSVSITSFQFRFALGRRREGRAQTVQAVRQATADKVLCLTQIEINVFLSFGGNKIENMRTLYQERCLTNEVVFNWEATSHKISQEEIIALLEKDMRDVIGHLDDSMDPKEKEVSLKKIEFLRISIMRAKLGRELVSLIFPITN